MPSDQKHVPKHRAAHRAPQAARRALLKSSLTISSMAVAATGVAVGTGSLALPAIGTVTAAGSASANAAAAAAVETPAAAATSAPSVASSTASGDTAGTTRSTGAAAPKQQAPAPDVTAEREQVTTRTDERDAADSLKADALSLGQGNTLARSESLSDQSPQVIAQALLSDYGWSQDQFGCLDSLWTRESGWNVHADNPSSSAYGIPQALPGSKMASAGPDWANNAVTQIKWGLGYIADRYGSPCGAWAHSQSSGFY